MRLLIRRNAHRSVPGVGVELASSPDTAGRERWKWHLRLAGTLPREGTGDLGDMTGPGVQTPASAEVSDTPAAVGSGAPHRVEVPVAAWSPGRGSAGLDAMLAADFDPEQVRCRVSRLPLGSRYTLDRDAGQLIVLVVTAGDVRAEDRHDLHELDVLVLAGDDPLTLDLEPATGGTAEVGLACLEAADGSPLAWVP